MTALARAYQTGRNAAFARFKLAATPKATHPTVQQSPLLRSQTSSQPPANSMQGLQAPTSPAGLKAVFDPQEQGRTHIEPTKKLASWSQHAALNLGQLMGGHGSAWENILYGILPPSWSGHTEEDLADLDRSSALRDWYRFGRDDDAPHPGDVAKDASELCTSCRKPKHYGPCAKPLKTKPDGVPLKQADFNLGLSGSDPKFVGAGESGPSTSPHYHSATADSSLARARDGRPAVEQADTGFRNVDALRGMLDPASQPERMYGGLVKQQSWNLPGSEGHSLFENRGPTVNPYEERLTRKSTPVGWGDEGKQRINRAFDQIDGAVDSTNMEGGWGAPSDGPAALG